MTVSKTPKGPAGLLVPGGGWLFWRCWFLLTPAYGQGRATPRLPPASPPELTQKEALRPRLREQEESRRLERAAARRKARRRGTKAQRMARTARIKKAFVASTELRPMAQQLTTMRTPAAYAGVTAWAHRQTGDAAAAAYLALGHAYLIDKRYAEAAANLRLVQPEQRGSVRLRRFPGCRGGAQPGKRGCRRSPAARLQRSPSGQHLRPRGSGTGGQRAACPGQCDRGADGYWQPSPRMPTNFPTTN